MQQIDLSNRFKNDLISLFDEILLILQSGHKLEIFLRTIRVTTILIYTIISKNAAQNISVQRYLKVSFNNFLKLCRDADVCKDHGKDELTKRWLHGLPQSLFSWDHKQWAVRFSWINWP